MSKDERGWNSSLKEKPVRSRSRDQPDGCQEGPFLNRQSVQAEEPEDGLGKGEGEPG